MISQHLNISSRVVELHWKSSIGVRRPTYTLGSRAPHYLIYYPNKAVIAIIPLICLTGGQYKGKPLIVNPIGRSGNDPLRFFAD
jgi:hypothetical protein